MAEQSKTVDKALDLLLAVGDGRGGRVGDLARRTGQSRTATLRLLTSLERRGFVRRTTDGFALGAALLRLGLQVEPAIRRAARPGLEALAAQFGETALVAVPDGSEAVAIDQVLGTAHRFMQVRYRPGHRHALTEAAHGRAILAFRPPSEIEAALGELPDGQAGALAAELDLVRRRGFVFSSGELEPGAAGLAAPILDGAGVALASIGVVAPDHRLPDLDELAAAVCRAAAVASDELVSPTQGGL
jgi:DNA-binding IclR family transcriptional regulator